MHDWFTARTDRKLTQLTAQQRYRDLYLRDSAQQKELCIAGKSYINFCSNDYLALADHPQVKQAAITAVETYGVGSGASQLICGRHQLHAQVEQQFANFLGYPHALLFSNGYMANLAVQTALAQRYDVILQDKNNHASLIDAGQLSAATCNRYRHNDMTALESLLAASTTSGRFIISDGVFSMDGDCANYAAIAQLAAEYAAVTIIDDAHGLGVMGEGGQGSWYQQTPWRPDILVVTLGKSMGSQGALVCADAATIACLQQTARTFIYTTAMPVAQAAAALASLELLQTEPTRLARLQRNISYFQTQARAAGLPILASASAIQPLLIGSETPTLALAEQCRQQGLFVTAIRPPTVPSGQCRIRLTLTSEHTRAELAHCISVLKELV